MVTGAEMIKIVDVILNKPFNYIDLGELMEFR